MQIAIPDRSAVDFIEASNETEAVRGDRVEYVDQTIVDRIADNESEASMFVQMINEGNLI